MGLFGKSKPKVAPPLTPYGSQQAGGAPAQARTGGYPPAQGGQGASGPPGYPPQGGPPQGAYPQQQGGYPPMQQQQQGGYPPQQGGYPPMQQQGGYPPQGGYQQGGAPQQQYGAPQGQQGGYPPQGQQYGAPAQQYGAHTQQYGGGTTASSVNDAGVMQLVTQKLNNIVNVNRLHTFYPPPEIQKVIDQVAKVDLRQLATEMSVNLEIALDLTSLALYDVVIYADDSSSMSWNGGSNIQELKGILEKTANIVGRFDHDGFSIRQMNTNLVGDHIRTATEAADYVSRIKFKGGTPLAGKLQERILEPMLFDPIRRNCLPKPLLIISITDGAPGESEEFVKKVIRNAKMVAGQSRYGDKAVALEFAQVGKDQGAQDFLGRLDADPVIGAMVDATSYYELEAQEYLRRGVQLTPDLWLVKLLVGAIDPEYDEADEGPR